MDTLRLLSRSTKLGKSQTSRSNVTLPSSGQNANPQLFSSSNHENHNSSNGTRKRKRGGAVEDDSEIDFFGKRVLQGRSGVQHEQHSTESKCRGPQPPFEEVEEHNKRVVNESKPLSLENNKFVLQKHKLKVTWLNPPIEEKGHRRKKKQSKGLVEKQTKVSLFPNILESFALLQSRFGISNRLSSNMDDQGYTIPTEVQLAALPLLLDRDLSYLGTGNTVIPLPEAVGGADMLTVAPTGSGKTLAFFIPLVQGIIDSRRSQQGTDKVTSAVILAPTKELVGQIVNEGKKLTNNTGVRVTQVRKGMRLDTENSTAMDGGHEAGTDPSSEGHTMVKSDILVSTPGTLESVLRTGREGYQPLSKVQSLVLDEADVLLDPLFREQTLAIWDALLSPHLQVSLWSATMGSNIEELAREQINRRRHRLSEDHGELRRQPPEAPLIRLVVGLKDSAVPNVQHRLTYAASEQGKLMSLRQILHPTSSSADAGPTLLPPFLVFTQTIERAVALHAELRYDIPPEAGGALARIAVLHADLSDAARARVMARFRAADIWVLITTDLLSRGVDFRGVNAVVNYDIPTSSAAYVHRVGRTGRAGRTGGVAITLYSKDDVPYLRNIANVVAAAQKQRGASGGGGGGGGDGGDDNDGVQPWLLDALPTLSKKVKQDLKRRGVESRTARGREKDPKAARQARISTKAGFVRRQENRRQGAIAGARRRQGEQRTEEGDASGSDFEGFDP